MNEELFFALLADVAVGFSSVFVSINFKRQNQYELHRTIHPTKVDTAMFVEILKKKQNNIQSTKQKFLCVSSCSLYSLFVGRSNSICCCCLFYCNIIVLYVSVVLRLKTVFVLFRIQYKFLLLCSEKKNYENNSSYIEPE